MQINHTHEVVLVARDGSRPPFSCYSKETLVLADTETEEKVEPTHGWCATCHHNCKGSFYHGRMGRRLTDGGLLRYRK